MKRYRVEVQASQEVIVEAKNEEEARMKVVDGKIDSIKRNSCDDMGVDVYVSEARRVD